MWASTKSSLKTDTLSLSHNRHSLSEQTLSLKTDTLSQNKTIYIYICIYINRYINIHTGRVRLLKNQTNNIGHRRTICTGYAGPAYLSLYIYIYIYTHIHPIGNWIGISLWFPIFSYDLSLHFCLCCPERERECTQDLALSRVCVCRLFDIMAEVESSPEVAISASPVAAAAASPSFVPSADPVGDAAKQAETAHEILKRARANAAIADKAEREARVLDKSVKAAAATPLKAAATPLKAAATPLKAAATKAAAEKAAHKAVKAAPKAANPFKASAKKAAKASGKKALKPSGKKAAKKAAKKVVAIKDPDDDQPVADLGEKEPPKKKSFKEQVTPFIV